MSFVRAEARAVLWQWREVLIGGAILLLGASWAFGSGGLLHWLGYAVLVLGGAVVLAGLQRVRFRMGHGGPGVVTVDEGQVSYFGPLNGGMVAMRELVRLEIDATSRPPVWRLTQPGQGALNIPLNAEGADALFDAFAVLPGIRTERMLAEMKREADHPIVIWQKQVTRLH